jgi:predicted ferric reductase
LVTLSVVLGLVLSMRWQGNRWPRQITNELHGFVTLLSLVFIGVHVAAVWLDPYLGLGWQEVFVPFASHYRPIWSALGIVALYLALAVWITTQLRARIGHTWWRRLHLLAFGVFGFSCVHGITAGTDTATPWAIGIYTASILLVGGLLQFRLLVPVGTRGRSHPNLATAVLLVTLGGVIWNVARVAVV